MNDLSGITIKLKRKVRVSLLNAAPAAAAVVYFV